MRSFPANRITRVLTQGLEEVGLNLAAPIDHTRPRTTPRFSYLVLIWFGAAPSAATGQVTKCPADRTRRRRGDSWRRIAPLALDTRGQRL